MLDINRKWDTCVILGASISGLLAADALSKHFEEVILVDKDKILTKTTEPRWGVPQGEHVHILLSDAVKSLQNRFPNIFSNLKNMGSTAYHITEGVKWYHHGGWLKQFESNSELISYSQTRPVLEMAIRTEVLALENINVLERSKFISYYYDESTNTILGVQIENENGTKIDIEGDLIIDAMGRSSHTLRFFDELGLDLPTIEKIDVNIKYVSTFFQDEDGEIAQYPLQAVYPNPPKSSRYGVISDVEGDRVIVTMMGIDGNHPSTDKEEFLDFMKNLDHPYLYEKLKNLEPIAPIRSFAFPTMKRVHYHEMENKPENFLAIGDSICHFDPLFGQGMAVTNKEADILEEILIQTPQGKLNSVGENYFSKIDTQISYVWDMVVAEDSRYDLDLQPNIKQKLYQIISNQIYQLKDDEYVLERYYKVLNLEEPPTYLLHPMVLLKILKNKLL